MAVRRSVVASYGGGGVIVVARIIGWCRDVERLESFELFWV